MKFDTALWLKFIDLVLFPLKIYDKWRDIVYDSVRPILRACYGRSSLNVIFAAVKKNHIFSIPPHLCFRKSDCARVVRLCCLINRLRQNDLLWPHVVPYAKKQQIPSVLYVKVKARWKVPSTVSFCPDTQNKSVTLHYGIPRNLRSQRWLWKLSHFGMWHRVVW